MLIRNAEVWATGLADVRIAEGVIVELAPVQFGGEAGHEGSPEVGGIIDAKGGALLPGLHDHHIHLAGLAVRSASVICGPPEVTTAAALAERLAAHIANRPGQGWIRGIGYHESVMGLPDAAALDALVADRPLRLQHRSGRMWLLN